MRSLEKLEKRVPLRLYLFLQLLCSCYSFAHTTIESNIIPLRYDLQIQLPTSSKKDPLIPAFFGSIKFEFQLYQPIMANQRRFPAFLPQFRPPQQVDGGAPLRLLAQKLENFENVTLYNHANGQYVPVTVRIEPKHVVLTTNDNLLAGSYTLNIERYTGIITYDKAIFYRDAGNHPILGSDLFPYYAPLVFPCAENFRLKTKFNVALIHPHNTIALSSMPAQDTSQSLNNNWKYTKFEQSNNISPFNLFIGVIPSEYEKTRSSSKFPIYIWTNRHLHPREIKETMTALAGKVYDELIEILQEPLSIEELNIVVMNDFNGTHSFGTIATSLEEFILADDLHRTAIIARMLAKQWIGGMTTISSFSQICFQEDLVEYIVNKVLASLYSTNSSEYQKYKLASYIRIQIAETFFAPGESVTLNNEPDELDIRSHCSLKGTIFLESLESIIGSALLINKVRQLISQNKNENFSFETFLNYLNGLVIDNNVKLADVYDFWQKNGGIPNVYVEKLGEKLRFIQMNNGRKAQMGQNWSQMPLWPLHIDVKNLSLPIKFMISQGLELAPIDNNSFVLTNLGYNNVYRVNYDPTTWQQIVTSMSNFSYSQVEKAQIVNDFCYFHSLGETGQEGNKLRRSFLELIRTRNEEFDLCEFYSFWCSAGNGKKINLEANVKLKYKMLMPKLYRILSNRKHYACFESHYNSGNDANAAKVVNELCHLAFGTDCL